MDKSRLEVIPYLSFSGDCEQALEVYIRAFGGEVIYISRWSEENCESPEQAGKVMHAEFRIGCTRMSGGDSFEKKGPNTNIKLMVHMGSTEEAENAISALLEGGGEVLWPLRPHPAPDDAGCGSGTRDPFGYTCIITCPNPEYKEDK
jgi:PhnB protein